MPGSKFNVFRPSPRDFASESTEDSLVLASSNTASSTAVAPAVINRATSSIPVTSMEVKVERSTTTVTKKDIFGRQTSKTTTTETRTTTRSYA